MAKIYIPSDYLDYNCKVVYNDYIRVYTNTNNTSWTDIYFKSDYYLKSGQSTYPNNVSCDSINTYTDNIYYRYDFDKSVVMFFIFAIVLIYFPFRIFCRAFGRWLRI